MDLLTIVKKKGFTEPEGRGEWQEVIGGICNERKFTMGWIFHEKKCTMGQRIFLLTYIFNCSHINWFVLFDNLFWMLCILIMFCPLDLRIVVCNKIVIHVGHICYYPPDTF